MDEDRQGTFWSPEPPGTVAFVAAPGISDPAALATPPTPFFSNLLGGTEGANRGRLIDCRKSVKERQK